MKKKARKVVRHPENKSRCVIDQLLDDDSDLNDLSFDDESPDRVTYYFEKSMGRSMGRDTHKKH